MTVNKLKIGIKIITTGIKILGMMDAKSIVYIK
jgi:hypothetical protein